MKKHLVFEDLEEVSDLESSAKHTIVTIALE